jgi:flagellar hook-basal body complex protein FliE
VEPISFSRVGPLQAQSLATHALGATGNIGGTSTGAGQSFQNVLGDLLQSNVQANQQANKAIEALATGQASDLHGVSLAVAQADLNFRLMLELRNRATESFQEVMRMQI